MELDQDSFAARVESVLSTSDTVVSDPNLAALTSPSFNPSSLSHSLPRTPNLDLLARSVHPLSSNRTEPLLGGPQHEDRQSFYSQPVSFTSNGLPLATSTSSSTLMNSAHASFHDSQVGSYDLPSRSTADVYQQHSMDISPSFQQQTHQNPYFSSSFPSSSSSFTEQAGSDLQSRGQFSSYASQSANPTDWRGESLSAAERVKLLGRKQSEHAPNTDKGGLIVKRESDDSLVQVGVEGREEDDEELEPADSDVDMDSTENGQEPEKKKKKWNKAPQSGKNWRSGLKRAPDGSWEVPPESAVKKANQSSDPLHSPSFVLSLTDSALTAEPSSTLTSTSNYKKPKLKAKPKPAQAIGSSNDSDAVSSLKKKVSRKKKQPAGTNSQGPTRSPSPISGLPNDQPTPTVSSSRARSYSQSVDPEGALEEEGNIEVTGRKSTKRRRIDEKEKEKEREREMEELLRRQRDEEDEESEDDQLYCVCNSRYDAESPMIACDMCAEWYHPKCVEIPEEEIELVDLFVCPKCHEETAEKTTWRTKCRSADCFKPAVPPLTKYCSTVCGTAHLTALLETKDIDLSRHWNQVEGAQRPSGVVIVNPDFPTSHPFTTTSNLASNTPVGPTQFPAPIKLGNTRLTSLDPSDHPATRHLHVMDGSLKTSIDKVQNQLSLLSNRLTLFSFASNRADMMPSLASLSLKDDPVVSPERSNSGSKRGPQKKKSSAGAGAGAGGSGQGDRPCGFDRRLILDEQDFGKYVDSEEGRALFAPLLEDDISDSRLKKEGEKEREGNESPVDPGFETYLRAGEKDLKRKQKMMSETDMEVDGSTGSDGHQHVKAGMEDTWCYRSKKKCEGHRGWQKIRLIDFQLEQSSKRNTLGLLERTRSILQQDIQIAEKRIRRAMGEPEVNPENKVETEIKTGISTAVPDRSSSYREEKDDSVVTLPLATTAAATVASEGTGTIAVNGGVGVISNSLAQVDLPTIS
ncbi:Uncharacterized PHD Zn-finger protein [Phaffia rhodozyma]|uniref:Uncharacterized PHD Zn-finger protein n=1 Tax=Phaffia rhodozyma TaxID=264483 RepID=A0A0F7SID7_PHARH|nr:Uncharacterized PHD Zn-finger protein [Phaffia rhodozyma]